MGGTKYIYEVIKKLSAHYKIVVVVENSSSLAISTYKKIKNVKLVNQEKPTSTSILYWLLLPVNIYGDIVAAKKIVESIQGSKIYISSMFPMNIVTTFLQGSKIQLCFEPFSFFYDKDFIKRFPIAKYLLIRLLALIYSPLDIFTVRKQNSVVTLNNTTKRAIEKIYKVNSTSIFTGIDLKHFHYYISKSVADKYKGKKVIVHSTDYSPVKRTDAMIKIFYKVSQRVKDAYLVITTTIDDTKEKEKLVNLARDLNIEHKVEFAGFIDYRLLPQIYSVAHVLVQCSYSEMSGTTSMALPVKEALSCGTIAIRYPVQNEDVSDGVNGYLVDPRNEEKMVKTIIKILKLDKARLKSMKLAARNSMINRYSWDKTARALSEIINNNLENQYD